MMRVFILFTWMKLALFEHCYMYVTRKIRKSCTNLCSQIHLVCRFQYSNILTQVVPRSNSFMFALKYLLNLFKIKPSFDLFNTREHISVYNGFGGRFWWTVDGGR